MKKQEKSIRKFFLGGLSLCIMLGMSACADTNESTDENDINSAGMNDSTIISNTSNYFSDWDRNGDSYLDEDEYSGGVFSSWDSNRDNRLDENEWNDGTNNYGVTGQSWADWDIDTDGFLNDGEYRNASNRAGWYRAWDSDGDKRLSQEEYDQGMNNRPNRND